MQPRWLPIALVALLATACLPARHAPRGFNVSSLHSDYSPVLELAVAIDSVPGHPDSLVVRVDSGIVRAPGELREGSTPIMRALVVSAMLARPVPPTTDTTQAPRPWEKLAEAEALPLVDSLRYGEARPVAAMRFVLPRPTGADAQRDFVLFHVHGGAVGEPVRMADGSVVAGRTFQGGIQVYACPTWALSGKVDRARAKVLARTYGAGC